MNTTSTTLPSGQTEESEELPQICSPAQVSKFTGVTTGTLAYWRFEGSHLPFIKLGRVVRYRRQDVLDFLEQNVFTSTAEAKAAR